MRGNSIVGWVVVAAVAALLSGCTADPGTQTGSADVTPSTALVTTTPTKASASASVSAPAPTVSAVATGRVDPNAPAGQCADTDLAVSVQNDPTGSGAGQRLAYVVFRNTGTSTCVLRGAPGVSLVGDGNGTQIGAAAARSESTAPVTIRPGAYALASLSFPNIDRNGGAYGDGEGHDPQCQAKAVDGYRVYPPHSFRAFFARTSNEYGCSTQLQTLRVSAVVPASALPFTPRF